MSEKKHIKVSMHGEETILSVPASMKKEELIRLFGRYQELAY